MAPFVIHAIVGGLALALLSAPLGCLIVWRRLTYMGETVAQAGLLGVALGLLTSLDQTAATLLAAAAMALGLTVLSRRALVPVDSLLGLLAHAALAGGVIATSLASSGSVDLMGYLFGDIFAVSRGDLAWILGGGSLILALIGWLWRPMLSLAIHAELAEAEGVHRDRIELAFMLLLALAVAISIKIVGVLLAIAFLIMPAVAARPLASTPEQMAIAAAGIGAVGVLAGLTVSFTWDIPGGPAIVLMLAMMALTSVLAGGNSTR